MSTDVNQPTEPKVLQRQPVCRYLRSKGMFITGKLDPEVEDYQIGDGHCWCNRTQTMLGPDNGFVNRKACVEGRSCYVAIL